MPVPRGDAGGPAAVDSEPWDDVRGAAALRVVARAFTLALAPAVAEYPAWSPAEWERVRRVCEDERLAAVTWLAAGALIRAHAPGATSARWRASYSANATRAVEQLGALRKLLAALEAARLCPLVLKGLPLAHRLYGDIAARRIVDLDLWIAPSERTRAHAIAVRDGWRHVDGAAPGDESFERTLASGAQLFLELHSSLVDERLAHLAVPAPERELTDVDGVPIAAHGGPLLPAYLAAHLAAHTFPPLLWWVDFATLWSALDAAAQRASFAAARRAGLARYLEWATAGAAAVRAAVSGDDDALRQLGYRDDGSRRDVHQLRRHVALAPSARAAARALAAWIRPAWAPARDGGVVIGTLRRARRHWRALLPHAAAVSSTRASATAVPRQMTQASRDVLAVARTVVDAGGEMWLVVTGSSMTPHLAEGDRVLLGRAVARPAVGDVVLLESGQGSALLHRVVAVDGDVVTTRGDACRHCDTPVPLGAVVARAIARRDVAGRVTALEPGWRFGAAAALRGAWRRARRVGDDGA